ncbi:MAG: porin [Marinifilaceae bacterium]
MKKYTLVTALLFSTTLLFAQDAKEQMKAFMEDGMVTWTNKQKDASFRIGGRVAIEGAYYFDDYIDRASGIAISEARLRAFSTFKDFDTKFDVDFAYNDVAMKDMYIRWHGGRNWFVKAGNYAEPFSAGNIQSSFDSWFILKSPTVSAMGTGRSVGATFRYYTEPFWAEAGFFSQKVATEKIPGDKGWGVSARALYRFTPYDDNTLSVGGSFNFRRPSANGFKDGKDKYNRYTYLQSTIGSNVDDINFLNAQIANSWGVYRYGAELIKVYRRFYLQAEYIGMTIHRRRDYKYELEQQLGGEFSCTDIACMKEWYGDASTLRFNGCYAQVAWTILGPANTYNYVEGFMNLPRRGSLQVMARYDFTDLNDTKGNTYFDGKFYKDAAVGKEGSGIGGGRINSFTVGVNYSLLENLVFKVNYNYTHLNSYYLLDKDLGTLAAKIQYQF